MRQHQIPGLMTKAVINLFEVIEIELDHREGLLLRARLL